ncbi:MAG: hypothetical protein Kow0031_29290 [Anaerolineae bacterium]
MPKNLFVALLLSALFILLPAHPAGANGPLHTVQPGDTLTAIAGSYGLSAADLAAANGLPQEGWLQPGQQLVIPAPAPMPVAAAPLPPTAFSGFGSPAAYYPAPPAQSQYYAPARPLPAAPVQAAPPANFTPYSPESMWEQPAQLPPAELYPQPAETSPYFAPQTAYPPAGYQPYPSNPTFQPAPAYASPANPAAGWPPAGGPAFAPPPRLNPALMTPNGEKWIDVNLSTQTLTALEGQTPVYRALVSTGLWDTPTVVGTYNIYVKYEKADMSGGSGADAYHLEDVPYVMYFHGGYGLHGTYWHSNFGQPMSHGCVNLHTLDARWLFDWAPVGTKVVTHY